jgi:hypothetical protein
VNCGDSRVLPNTIDPKSSSLMKTFMVVFPIGKLVATANEQTISMRKQLSAACRKIYDLRYHHG